MLPVVVGVVVGRAEVRRASEKKKSKLTILFSTFNSPRKRTSLFLLVPFHFSFLRAPPRREKQRQPASVGTRREQQQQLLPPERKRESEKALEFADDAPPFANSSKPFLSLTLAKCRGSRPRRPRARERRA